MSPLSHERLVVLLDAVIREAEAALFHNHGEDEDDCCDQTAAFHESRRADAVREVTAGFEDLRKERDEARAERPNPHLVDRVERAEADNYMLRRAVDRIRSIVGPKFGEAALVEAVRELKASAALAASDTQRLERELADARKAQQAAEDEAAHLRRYAPPLVEDYGAPVEPGPSHEPSWWVRRRHVGPVGERFFVVGPDRDTVMAARADLPDRVDAIRKKLAAEAIDARGKLEAVKAELERARADFVASDKRREELAAALIDKVEAERERTGPPLDREAPNVVRPQVTRDLIISTAGGPAWTIEGDPSRGAAGQWRAVGPWRDERAHADGDARGGLGFHRADARADCDHPLCVCGHPVEAHGGGSELDGDECVKCDCAWFRSSGVIEE